MFITMPGRPSGRSSVMRMYSSTLLVRDSAQILEQVAVEAEVRAQHLGDTEGEMAVWHREENGLGEQRAEELDLLLVA